MADVVVDVPDDVADSNGAAFHRRRPARQANIFSSSLPTPSAPMEFQEAL
jgi:hypothetical protein